MPHIADLLKKQLDGTLLEVLQRGTVSPELALRLAQNQGVYFQNYALLSHGAIITGLLWGSIVVFIMDGDLRKAAFFSFLALFLSLVGLIHAAQIGLSLSPVGGITPAATIIRRRPLAAASVASWKLQHCKQGARSGGIWNESVLISNIIVPEWRISVSASLIGSYAETVRAGHG